MPRGGKRPGSGRKTNALTKRTRAIAEKALALGKTPLEVMLDNMRHFQQVALDAEAVLDGLTAEEITGTEMKPDEQFKVLLAKAKHAAGLRQMAHECARDAAPFMHAKLASIQMEVGKPGEFEESNADQLRQRLIREAEMAGEGGLAAALSGGTGEAGSKLH